jgi:hypothetical protein
MIAVARKATSAIQFCGSAMVSVPNGGRKKKLKASVASMAMKIESLSPQNAETTRTATRKVSATVVGFTEAIFR